MNKKKVIIVCEESQAVCRAFREAGHEAYSFDLLPASGGFPQWHIQADNDMHIKDILYKHYWDMVIAHPPCTRLTNAVWWYILKNGLHDEVYQAAMFFNMILNCPVEKIAVENPIPNKGARQYIRKYDQIIQPYQFGDDASKATCLWLKNLPILLPTQYCQPRYVNGKPRWANQTDGGWNKLGPSEDRAMLRSKTYTGIARAMALQWGNYA